MSSSSDLTTSLAINSAVSVALVVGYAIFRNQPVNTSIYFAKWVKRGAETGPPAANPRNRKIGKYVNLSLRTYLHIMDWFRASLSVPEEKLIQQSGLDSAIYLRMLLLGIQIFFPMMAFGFAVLVPIDVTDDGLNTLTHGNLASYNYSAVDTITISNIPNKSPRLWAHIVAAYLCTIWACWLLFRFYSSLVNLRFSFLAEQDRKEDQFTILCRCVPKHSKDESTDMLVDKFFRVNHPDHFLLSTAVFNANKLSKFVAKKENYKNKVTYLEDLISRKSNQKRPTMKLGFLGLRGERVDKLDYYSQQIDELTEKIRDERVRVLSDKKSVMPAAFISFESRWAAAVCAQTTQSKDSSTWLTDWAPEPRNVYWANLPIPYLQLNSRKLLSLAILVGLILFYTIPVSFVQGLASLPDLEKTFPFLKSILKVSWISKIVTGFLPGFALKIFLLILPYLVWYLAVMEGHVSYSKIEKHACINYLAFLLVIAFLGNIVAGSLYELLQHFIDSPTAIRSQLASSIPTKSTFFITYIMFDGWTGCAIELFRVYALLIHHFRSATMLRTERDKEEATPVSFINYTVELPRLGLYFLLGFVYAPIAPLILPFILVYLAVAYVVYRNQIINVYEQRYESAGGYWPVMFAYAVIGLLAMHATLIGLMALKETAYSTALLIPLPIGTALFWYYCWSRFEGSFRCYPLQEAKAKDIIENEREPLLNHREFLETAYMHPVLRTTLTRGGNVDESDSEDAVDDLLHRSSVHPSRHNSGDYGSKSRSLPTAQKLLPSGSSTPNQLVNRPMPSESSTPHRASFSESPIRDLTGSNRYMPRSLHSQGSTSPNWKVNIPNEEEPPRG